MQTTTYHWHAVSFDGPVLPFDRSYQVPDALTPGPNGSVNLGYQTNSPTFTLNNVSLTGASKAYLTYNVYWYCRREGERHNQWRSRLASGPEPGLGGASLSMALHRAARRTQRPARRYEHSPDLQHRVRRPVSYGREHRLGSGARVNLDEVPAGTNVTNPVTPALPGRPTSAQYWRGRTTRTRSRSTVVRAGVSCIAPHVAAFGAAKYYELIFERERVEDAAAA